MLQLVTFQFKAKNQSICNYLPEKYLFTKSQPNWFTELSCLWKLIITFICSHREFYKKNMLATNKISNFYLVYNCWNHCIYFILLPYFSKTKINVYVYLRIRGILLTNCMRCRYKMIKCSLKLRKLKTKTVPFIT